MSAEQVHPIIVSGAFSSFLLTFLYAVLRWSLADARSRGKRGWPLAALMVGVPVSTFLARIAFRSFVPRLLSLMVMLGVPLLVWVVWLFVRPPRQQKPVDGILGGRDGVASRWILILSLTASGYGVAVVWLTQFVMYPMYLSVPPAGFPEYYAPFLVAIVFPVIVALSLSWVLAALLILNRPRPVPPRERRGRLPDWHWSGSSHHEHWRLPTTNSSWSTATTPRHPP